jgi:hypothetical protein
MRAWCFRRRPPPRPQRTPQPAAGLIPLHEAAGGFRLRPRDMIQSRIPGRMAAVGDLLDATTTSRRLGLPSRFIARPTSTLVPAMSTWISPMRWRREKMRSRRNT